MSTLLRKIRNTGSYPVVPATGFPLLKAGRSVDVPAADARALQVVALRLCSWDGEAYDPDAPAVVVASLEPTPEPEPEAPKAAARKTTTKTTATADADATEKE